MNKLLWNKWEQDILSMKDSFMTVDQLSFTPPVRKHRFLLQSSWCTVNPYPGLTYSTLCDHNPVVLSPILCSKMFVGLIVLDSVNTYTPMYLSAWDQPCKCLGLVACVKYIKKKKKSLGRNGTLICASAQILGLGRQGNELCWVWINLGLD